MKSVQGDSGHAQLKMVSDVYSHILDEDRCKNAQNFERAFYAGKDGTAATPMEENDSEKLLRILTASPELASQILAKLGTIAL